ncbi:hypothetical protein ACTXGL_09195 [Psychrobacter sp. T6-6]|uniref:hypothetical protein n=1 Tax=Psychrobacter sp. T6-6 TaxID=3457452 RepID=UPI003FD07A9F
MNSITVLLSAKSANLVGCQVIKAARMLFACSITPSLTLVSIVIDNIALRSKEHQYIPRITPHLQVYLPKVKPSIFQRTTPDKNMLLKNVAHSIIGGLCNIFTVLHKSIYGQTPYSQETKSHKPNLFQFHADNILVKRDDIALMHLSIMSCINAMSITTGDTEHVFQTVIQLSPSKIKDNKIHL